MGKIKIFIRGVPYAKNKVRGNIEGPREWTRNIILQTQQFPKVKGPCKVKILYQLPPDKYPEDHPYGIDLDNLTKRLLDALNDTVFSSVPGGDGCVQELFIKKVKVNSVSEAGASLEIYEL